MENSKKGKGKGSNDAGGAAQQHVNHEDGPDRDKVKVEREARRLAKQAAKQKIQDKSRNLPQNPSPESKNKEDSQEKKPAIPKTVEPEKSNKQPATKAERRKERKSSEKESKKKQSNEQEVTDKLEKLKIDKVTSPPAAETTSPVVVDNSESEKKSTKQMTKAERRAMQEAQRAAKATKTSGPNASSAPTKQSNVKKEPTTPTSKSKSPSESANKSKVVRKLSAKTTNLHRVKLFNHLYTDKSVLDNTMNASDIHPAIIRLGVQYASGVVKGCNARCLAFMNAIKAVIQEYETPPDKVFSRGIEEAIQPCLVYLHKCRPLAVSVTNAMKYIKWQTTQLPPGESDSECKALLLESIDTYIRDQIEKAVEAISITVQEKISDGDVLLTFGCSSVIQNILDEAKSSKRDFRVIVVDARPCHEGQEMLRRLVAKDIKCTCVLINAVGFIMPEVTKVLLGAHALLANGYVMSRAGTAQVALIAKSYNVPVLVCCETHKFSERVQTDAFVYNEIGDSSELVETKNNYPTPLANWKSIPHLTPLNLCYDVTPPELVSAVVTEVAILPCTSVPVILRIKPSEIGY